MPPGKSQLIVTALDGIPGVQPGADLAGLLIAALEANGVAPAKHDVLVVTQKIVSKAEGRYLDLADMEPSARARDLALVTGKDVRLVEAVLREAEEVLRARRNVLIVATRSGLVIANAGIDLRSVAWQESLMSEVTLGVLSGLVLGKFVGITLFSWVAVKLRLARLPAGVRWSHLAGAAWLAGIGFTMSLFIAGQAFPVTSDFAAAKIAVFAASILSAVIGVGILWRAGAGAER